VSAGDRKDQSKLVSPLQTTCKLQSWKSQKYQPLNQDSYTVMLILLISYKETHISSG